MFRNEDPKGKIFISKFYVFNWEYPLFTVCDFTLDFEGVCTHRCRLPVQVSFRLLTLHHSLQSLQLGHRLTHGCLRHRVVSLRMYKTHKYY